MNQFVIDGLNKLETIIIGWRCFSLCNGPKEGSKCLIMNCDRLKQIHICKYSFMYYESLELKNLSSLISIQLGWYVFSCCHSIVFESMNDWMNNEWDLIRLQSITLGSQTLCGDGSTVEWNELVMKSMNDADDWLIRSSFSISNWWHCQFQ